MALLGLLWRGSGRLASRPYGMGVGMGSRLRGSKRMGKDAHPRPAVGSCFRRNDEVGVGRRLFYGNGEEVGLWFVVEGAAVDVDGEDFVVDACDFAFEGENGQGRKRNGPSAADSKCIIAAQINFVA